MIREEIKKLLDQGVIRPIKLTMGGTISLCKDERRHPTTVHWPALNEQLVADSDGLGDIQTIFDGLERKRFFTQIDLASGRNRVKRHAQNSLS